MEGILFLNIYSQTYSWINETKLHSLHSILFFSLETCQYSFFCSPLFYPLLSYIFFISISLAIAQTVPFSSSLYHYHVISFFSAPCAIFASLIFFFLLSNFRAPFLLRLANGKKQTVKSAFLLWYPLEILFSKLISQCVQQRLSRSVYTQIKKCQ